MTGPEIKPVIEHINITVSDAERSAKILCALFDWEIRWHGPALNGGQTFHVGTRDQYIAVYQPKQAPSSSDENATFIGHLNHIGVVVSDLDVMEARVIDAGYRPFNHGDYEPGRRFYFYDDDKTEFEIVCYG